MVVEASPQWTEGAGIPPGSMGCCWHIQHPAEGLCPAKQEAGSTQGELTAAALLPDHIVALQASLGPSDLSMKERKHSRNSSIWGARDGCLIPATPTESKWEAFF